jgi:CHAD domain-containing protein
MHSNASSPAPSANKQGLLYWAQRVLAECEHTASGFEADPVHDLRVAIRRCRSMADGLLAVDPDPAWKQLKRLGKPLFGSLGELRDVQVMMEWVQKLSAPDDPGRAVLLSELQAREEKLKLASQQALADFDRKHWLSLCEHLATRMEGIPPDGSVFQSLAVERWNEAHELHRRALRNRSGTAYHALRIGVKRLRYTVENFLPTLHERWSKDLRTLQDALGEVHDFDVLWTMLRLHPEIAPEVREHWRATVQQERNKRLALYRERMVGRNSLWRTWRAALPSGEALRRSGMERFRIRAAFLDPDFQRAQRIGATALHLYDGLAGPARLDRSTGNRGILEAAALLHGIGRAKREQGHRKRGFRLLLRLTPPPGWSAEEMRFVAIIARYQRGPIAPVTHSMFAGVPRPLRTQMLRLAGILRLAAAISEATHSQNGQLRVEPQGSTVVIRAAHLNGQPGPQGERLAQAKYLLEASCGVTIRLETEKLAVSRR